MKKLIKHAALMLLALSITSCGGSSSSSSTNNPPPPPPVTEPPSSLAKFSLGLSDAPVDDAIAVYIELDSIRLIDTDESQGRQETLIETFTNEDGIEVETIQVNLLDYQGSAQVKIIDEAQGIELSDGIYNIELNVIDAGSYVLLDNDATEHPIKVPSSRLRLGEFAIDSSIEQVNNQPAYTIEFDLRQSLVLRGNINNNNGFIIKPHGVRIVGASGGIAGNVSAGFTNLGMCTVYLYDSEATEFGDVFDAEDEDFVPPEGGVIASAPVATALVSDDGTYAIGFLQAGSYQVALTCGTDIDDNIQFDGLTIPSAGENTPDIQTVDVVSGQTAEVNF